jgi:hypothetical protein
MPIIGLELKDRPEYKIWFVASHSNQDRTRHAHVEVKWIPDGYEITVAYTPPNNSSVRTVGTLEAVASFLKNISVQDHPELEEARNSVESMLNRIPR